MLIATCNGVNLKSIHKTSINFIDNPNHRSDAYIDDSGTLKSTPEESTKNSATSFSPKFKKKSSVSKTANGKTPTVAIQEQSKSRLGNLFFQSSLRSYVNYISKFRNDISINPLVFLWKTFLGITKSFKVFNRLF